MKNIKYVLLVFVFFSFNCIIPCFQKHDLENNDLKRAGYKGKIKIIKKLTYYSAKKDEPHRKMVSSYNAYGNKIKVVSQENNAETISTYFYNSKQNLRLVVVKNELGVITQTKNSYSKQGNLTESVIYSHGNKKTNILYRKVYQYKDNLLVEKKTLDKSGVQEERLVFLYDVKHRLKEKCFYDSSNLYIGKLVKEYDKSGKLQKETTFNGQGIVRQVVAYRYNKSGLKISEDAKLFPGNSYEYKTEIKYDNNANYEITKFWSNNLSKKSYALFNKDGQQILLKYFERKEDGKCRPLNKVEFVYTGGNISKESNFYYNKLKEEFVIDEITDYKYSYY